jgi:para-aminobenzoate synthetase component 1
MVLPLPEPVTGSIELVRAERIAESVDDAAFLERVERLAERPYSSVLLSGGRLDCSRYSLAAWEPLLVFKSKGTRISLQTGQEERVLEGDPLACLDGVFRGLRPAHPLVLPPFCGGALGYFAYDLKDSIERLPQTACDDRNLPDILLSFPREMLIHDRLEGTLHHLALRASSPIALKSLPGPLNPSPARETLGTPPSSQAGQERCGAGMPFSRTQDEGHGALAMRVGQLSSNFTHDAYLEAVRRVRHYIREGDVYQVNLSQRFHFAFEGDPFTLWRRLYALNPAPFYAFIQAGDHQVLSTSMERFLFRRGSSIETRPIKGTRKRGATPAEDEALRRELQQSPKDDAELSMIVDLLRNDLGRICRGRSVRVAEHKRLESYQNVHHLISIVVGRLRDGVSHGEMLRATFPGGSITGCPKVRAMEIIDELEPHVRHVYTGAIGYLGWHENADLNVAIRTALVHEGKCFFSVGGGIVHDSNEEDEYEETLHKARTLFDLMERLERKNDR